MRRVYSGWTEVGDGCFARRYSGYDVSVGVVVGSAGLLVVDTRSGPTEAAELRADIGELSTRRIQGVVNTHWHFDHCFGNSAFAGVAIYGHETVPDTLAARADAVRRELAAKSPEWHAEMDALEVVPPAQLLASVATVDLGDRIVELVHPGRGHTDGDVLVRVPDADVVYVGDLVEESGPLAYGDDSYPFEWATTMDHVVGMLTDDTAVIPGHGAVVDRAFVLSQREQVTQVAETIRQLAHEGVAEEDALQAGTWPFPPESLAEAVRRGYAALGGPNRRQLPMAD